MKFVIGKGAFFTSFFPIENPSNLFRYHGLNRTDDAWVKHCKDFFSRQCVFLCYLAFLVAIKSIVKRAIQIKSNSNWNLRENHRVFFFSPHLNSVHFSFCCKATQILTKPEPFSMSCLTTANGDISGGSCLFSRGPLWLEIYLIVLRVLFGFAGKALPSLTEQNWSHAQELAANS